MCIDAVIQDSSVFKALKLLVLPVIFFVAASSSAQIIYGNTVSNNEHKYLFLEEVIGGNAYVIDSVRINNGQYQFNKPESPMGYYRLKYAEQNRIDFINDQNPIEINFNSPILQNDLEVIQSKENKILWQFKYYSRDKQKELKSIMVMQSHEETGSNAWNILQKKRDSITKAKSIYLTKLCDENPGTLFNRLVGATNKSSYLNPEEEKNRFFEHIDFSDPLMVRSSILPSLMMNYFQLHTEYSEEGFIESIDRILSLSRANTTNYEFCLNFILTLFNKVGPDVVFQHVVEKYLLNGGCSETNISDHIKILADNYRAIQPGNEAPLFVEKNVKKELIDLTEFLLKKDFTILFFWSSLCGFCSESTPKLAKWKANKSNIQVLGISLDQDENELTTYLEQNKIPWENISDLKGWKSDIVLKYKIHKTPSYYVINDKGIIMAKPANLEDLMKLNLW